MSKTYYHKTLAVTARPRSQRLREAGYYGGTTIISNGGQTAGDGGLSDLFEEVLDDDSTVVGVKALYDLNIIQSPGDESAGTEDEIKNVTELLRLQERINLDTEEEPRYGVKFTGGVVSESDVVAYGPAGSSATPTAYDRLDPATFGVSSEAHAWPTYDSAKDGWILSAALGWNLDARVAELESKDSIRTLDQLDDVEVTGASEGQALVYRSGVWRPGTVSGPDGGETNHSHSNYPALDIITNEKIQAWDQTAALFEPIKESSAVVGINALYPLSVAGTITADGDVVAYGAASGPTSPTAYDRLDPLGGLWPSYDEEKAGWVLSAALGWDLNSRVSALDLRVADLENNPGSGTTTPGHSHGNLQALDLLTEEKIQSWDEIAELFDPLKDNGAVTGIRALHPLSVAGTITADGDVVAYGAASGPTSPTAYDRLDPLGGLWPSYDEEKAGWVLSAALGWDLNARVAALDGRIADLESNPGSGTTAPGHSHDNLPALDTITTEKVQAWEQTAALFEPIEESNVVVGIRALYPLSVAGTITAEGDVVAYGTASGTASPAAYDRLDPLGGLWPSYDEEKAGWVLSAALGWDLNSRVSALESNSGSGGGGGESGHSHTNLSVLAAITAEKVSGWDSAVASAHTHSNKSVLDGITSGNIANWNRAANYYNLATFDLQGNTLATQTWVNGQLHWHSNKSVLDGITSGKVSNWDTAYANQHTHSNKAVLDGITSGKVSNWDAAYANQHTHSNKSVLDGITSGKVSNWDTAYANQHTHSNKSVLDGITSGKVNNWDAAYTNQHTHTDPAALNAITSALINNWTEAYNKRHEHNNMSELNSINAAKIQSWDAAAAGQWLPLTGGALTGNLTGPTAGFNSLVLGTTTAPGTLTIMRGSNRIAVISIDSAGNLTISSTSTSIINVAGTVRASGDFVGYS